MITIFNRCEIENTYSLERQGEVRQILSACGIEYRTIVRQSNRNFHRQLWIDDLNKNYVIYVKKKDYDDALKA